MLERRLRSVWRLCESVIIDNADQGGECQVDLAVATTFATESKDARVSINSLQEHGQLPKVQHEIPCMINQDSSCGYAARVNEYKCPSSFLRFSSMCVHRCATPAHTIPFHRDHRSNTCRNHGPLQYPSHPTRPDPFEANRGRGWEIATNGRCPNPRATSKGVRDWWDRVEERDT